ncbi:MAG: flagellin [Selenomonas sp.]|nr:flagellin [Selenomonas sp.]
MAMKIANNMPAVNSLNIMGSNSSRLAKDMARLSAGLKITGAGDDASGYSIAKRMRAQIRGLDACAANVNTGYNMLKTAAEAVQCQLDILKKMREITLKASDDTYSQKDRDVLAIEADELFNQLDLIAEETTYNGMTLLNHRTEAVQNITQVSQTNQYEPFDPWGDEIDNTTIGEIFASGGDNTSIESVYNIWGVISSSHVGSMTLDFSNALSGHTIEDFNLQGFSVMCTNCSQFATVVFDTSRELGSGERQDSIRTSGSFGDARQYIIGLKGARNADDIANAVYDGILAANSAKGTNVYDNVEKPNNYIGRHNLRIERSGSTISLMVDAYSLSSNTLPVFYNGIKGVTATVEVATTTTAVEGFHPWEDHYIQSGTKASENTQIRLWNTSLEALFPPSDSEFLLEPEEYPNSYSTADFPDPDEYPERYEDYQGTDTQKKQQLWRDEIWHLTKKGAQSKGEVLRTREGAEGFLKDLDQAIKYALLVSTDLGSQMMRMEICAANITISHENVLASESTISDADMAKEMVSFARDNLLLQASQSMLAQANSESSSVLGLLQ